MALEDYFTHSFSKRPTYTGYLKTMRKAGVNKVVLRKWMHLCFILQATERLRENDPVVVLLKGTARRSTGVVYALTEACTAEQRAPGRGLRLRHYIFLNKLLIEHASTSCFLTSEIFTRSCFMVSRSRMVTVSSVSV